MLFCFLYFICNCRLFFLYCCKLTGTRLKVITLIWFLFSLHFTYSICSLLLSHLTLYVCKVTCASTVFWRFLHMRKQTEIETTAPVLVHREHSTGSNSVLIKPQYIQYVCMCSVQASCKCVISIFHYCLFSHCKAECQCMNSRCIL